MGLMFSTLMIAEATVAFAQTFGSFTAVPDQGAIILDGPIGAESALDFQSAIAASGEVKTVVLHSPGGQVLAALEIARVINDRSLMTFVAEGSDCASACSILFFSGKQRVALGALGVHQMSSSGDGNLSGLQYLLADVLSAFDAYGVDDRVLQQMLRTPPADMHYFSLEEKDSWGIDRYSDIEPKSLKISFDSYPPSEFYTGTVTLPDFEGRDRWARMFRSRINEATALGPNFAGHFTVVEIGCGMSCRLAYVVDVSNGQVFNFPYGGEEQFELGLVYASDSRLLRSTWKTPYWEDVNQTIDTCVSQDMLWNGTEFQIVHEEKFEIASGSYCSIE
jgi:hypothetical protein